MSKINIIYLSHDKDQKLKHSNWKIFSHFINKIKDSNKKLLSIKILSTKGYPLDHSINPINGVDVEYMEFSGRPNYLQKISYAQALNSEYSFKLDDDCHINNHIWDFIIENTESLNENGLLLAPVLSNNIPFVEKFIDGFVTDENVKEKLYNFFLSQDMPNNLWGVDYRSLNYHTLLAKKWSGEDFFKGVTNINHYYKGIHPIRINLKAQIYLNEYVLENYNRLLAKNDYLIEEFYEPYYTNSAFLIKTQDWKNAMGTLPGDIFDEVSLNLYKEKTGKKFLYIENSYSTHTMYNTVFGDTIDKKIFNWIEYEKKYLNSIIKTLNLA